MTDLIYRVPYADTDQMGVVYYANYFVYFERCRNELLREAGYTYLELEKSGLLLPVTEAVCRYRSSARYDDLLTVRGRVAEVKGVRVKIECRVYRGEELLVEGYTVHACIDAETHRPVRVPAHLAALEEKEDGCLPKDGPAQKS